MSQMPIETNVVLTADNGQYDAAMQSSAMSTDKLASSVDSLTKKISDLSKSAGHKAMGFAAADIASITAATAAWASYENQLSRLNAQAAITNRNRIAETRTLEAYTKAVQNVRRGYGASTGEAASLVETISKLTENRTQRTLGETSKIFMDMSKATGESSSGLATSVLQLQKVMGTSAGGQTTRRLADQLTYFSQQTTMSAQGLAEFSAQIAPVGQLLDMNQDQIVGFSAAFAKAGQDGYAAANAFNKIASDIAYATQSGSPQLANYAKILGLTTNEFKKIEGAEQVVQIFERLGAMGPQGINEMNRLGLDGVRNMRVFAAMAQQSGGIRASLGMAQDENIFGGSAIEGAKASMHGITDEFAKIKQNIMEAAELFGSKFAPAIEGVMKLGVGLSAMFRNMMEGPFGDIVSEIAGLAAVLATAGGAILSFAGPLAQLATAALFLKSSGVMGLREGFRGAPKVVDGVSQMNQGETGTKIAANGSWFQRYQYNAGNRVGQGLAMASGVFGDSSKAPLWQRASAAGLNAAAWATRNVGAPIYSPLGFRGFNDPTQRQRFFNDSRSPLQQMRDSFNARRGMFYPTGSGQMGIDRGVSLFDKDVRVTDAGRVTSSAAAVAAANAATVRSAGTLNAALSNAARGVGVFAGAMTSAAGNAAWLGARGLGKVAGYAGRNPGVLGMGAMMGMGAAGVQSNALMFGATGLMFGGVAGAAGLALGGGMDIYQQNKRQNENLDLWKDAVAKGTLTESWQAGAALTDEANRVSALSTGAKSGIPLLQNLGIGFTADTSMKNTWEKLKLGAESLFTGENALGERISDAEKVTRYNEDVAGAFSAVASRQGLTQELGLDKFNFTDEKSWAKLDQVLASITPNLEQLGLTSEDVIKAWGEGGEAWTDMLDKIATPGKYTGVWDSLRGSGRAGQALLGSPEALAAIQYQEDASAFYGGVSSIYGSMRRGGMGLRGIIRSSETGQQTQPENSREYELLSAVTEMAQQTLAYKTPFMSRDQAFKRQAGITEAIVGVNPETNEQAAQQQEAMAAFMQAAVEQGQYFKQMLAQQREFNISQARAEEDFGISRERMEDQYNLGRARAQDDFHQQREWQEHDYQLGRQRAEFNYNLQRQRGSADYHRSIRRGQNDFDRTRRQQEQDHQHQVVLMTEQTAKSVYNIYERARVQSTNSASWLVYNAGDQLKRLQEQNQNLDTVRSMGLSDDAIQQMGFTDANNAQQLARFVSDVANNPDLIKQLNEAIRARMKAAKKLVTDESSTEWQEFERQYKISRNRALDAFERSVNRSHRDFNRQMQEMEDDFHRSMNQQATDYETTQDRQQEQFSKSMKRGAEDYAIAVDNMVDDFGRSMSRAQADLARMSKDIGGNLETILEKSTNKLGGVAGKQAKVVLDALRGLDVESSGLGIQLMEHMADIFGFKYKAPKLQGLGVGGQSSTDDTPQGFGSGGFASGGVLPGYTPGQDVHHFQSKTAGSLSLSGGEAIMVPEWTKMVGGPAAVAKMNAEARAGAVHVGCQHFASGGVYDPDKKVYMDGEPVTAITKAQILLAEKLGKRNISVMQGSWQPYTSYSGTSHMGPGVVDVAPGDFKDQYWMRRVGFAAWGRNFKGAATAGSGAHVHAVSRIDPGAANHPQLSSFARGEDGLYGGPDYGPNPPMLPDLMERLKRFVGIAVHGGDSGGSSKALLNSILKDNYPALERAASKYKLGGGFEHGQWSKRMNKMVRSAYNNLEGLPVDDWYGKGSIFNSPQMIGIGEKGPEAVIPLNERGASFMSDVLNKSSAGLGAKAVNVPHSTPMVAHTIHSYKIDRSTTFSGPITVQANNPNELISKLKTRQRVMALSQASLGGSRT